MAAVAQIDAQVDHVAATRAEKQRRTVRGDARSIGCDQDIRFQQPIFVKLAQLSEARRADFFAHFDQ
jgi:hypothetical protein